METFLLDSLDSLRDVSDGWRRLSAHNPLLSPDWLLPWWENFGTAPETKLAILACRDDKREVVGIAPFYVCHQLGSRHWLTLGNGTACTDYMGLLSSEPNSVPVARSVVQYLSTHSAAGSYLRRCSLSLEASEESSQSLMETRNALEQCGFRMWQEPIGNSYRIELPERFEDFLATRSASARRKARKVIARIESGAVRFHRETNPEHLVQRLAELERLHQARRVAIGQAGCYADERFGLFLREAIVNLAKHGQVAIEWCEQDQQIIASHLVLQGTDTIYMYQSGIDPTAMDIEPGHLLTVSAIKRAIDDGFRYYDFLRGDEAYKSFWGGKPVPLVSLHATPPQVLSRIAGYTRESLWHAKQSTKHVLQFVTSFHQVPAAKR